MYRIRLTDIGLEAALGLPDGYHVKDVQLDNHVFIFSVEAWEERPDAEMVVEAKAHTCDGETWYQVSARELA